SACHFARSDVRRDRKPHRHGAKWGCDTPHHWGSAHFRNHYVSGTRASADEVQYLSGVNRKIIWPIRGNVRRGSVRRYSRRAVESRPPPLKVWAILTCLV